MTAGGTHRSSQAGQRTTYIEAIMRTCSLRQSALLVAVFCFNSSVSRVAGGQSIPQREPFTIVVVDTFRYHNADAVILRRPNETPHDLIVVDRGKLRPSILSEAAVLLRVVRQRTGETPTERMLVRVPKPEKTRQFQRVAGEWARQLEVAPRRQVPGLGLGSTMTINLP